MVVEIIGSTVRELDSVRLDSLRAAIDGDVVLPSDARYDEIRAIWNARHDRKPALIVQAAGTADVQAAVRFAVENGLPLSVRSGGHGVAGTAVAENGLMIDLSGMKAIEVDPYNQVAVAQPGLTWGEYNDAVAPHGLATPSGKLTGTGLGGLTVGGGIGWLVRKHGLTIDHLIAAEIVLASGEAVIASDYENSDLFWGIRGGGAQLGVVTGFTFKLVPIPAVYGGMIAFPIAVAGDVLRFYREFITSVPEELTSVSAMLTHPEAGKLIAIAVCYAGPAAEGERAVAPIANFRRPAMVQLLEMPYAAMPRLLSGSAPAGINRVQRSSYVDSLDDGLIDRLESAYQTSKSPHNVVLIEHYGGAMSRVAPDATAFPHRNREINLMIDMGWAPGDDSVIGQGWGEELWTSIQPFVTGSGYVNFLDDEGQERLEAAFGPENYRRLAALKRRYDPAGLFDVRHSAAR